MAYLNRIGLQWRFPSKMPQKECEGNQQKWPQEIFLRVWS